MYGTARKRLGRVIPHADTRPTSRLMRPKPVRARHDSDDEEPDQWLLDAASRAGHRLTNRERSPGTSVWRMLLSAGVPDDEVLRIACAASGAEPADFGALSPALAAMLPHGVAMKHRVAPLGVRAGTLGVATSNPRNAALERELASATKQRVRLYAASPSDVIRAQGIVYATVYGTHGDVLGGTVIPAAAPAPLPPPPAPRPAEPVRRPIETVAPADDEAQFSVPDPAPAAPRPPAPDLADRLLATACAERAASVILEPVADGGFLVRFGIDGIIADRFRIPEAHAGRLLATLRARAHVGEAGTGRAHSGRMTSDSLAGPVSIRVSMETVDAARERVTLRLASPTDLRALNELGYAAAEQERLRQLLGVGSGLIIVAGPAGAGTTTTLYAAAREASAQGRVVATVEELIEHPLEGIAQTQLAGTSRATLASAVRGVLASAGDVVVIGAPLDAGTLEQCDAGAQHRRLVIATLDSPDLPSTLERLLTLHPDRTSLAPVLAGVVVQRLVRRLCPECAAPQDVSELTEQQQRLLHGLPTSRLRRRVGCRACRNSGFHGRTALAEVVGMTPELRKGISRGVAPVELARLARRTAKTTLWLSGIDRVLEGVTTLAELLDTVPAPNVAGGATPQGDIDALLTQLLGEPRMRVPAPAEGGDARSAMDPTPPVASFTIVEHEAPAMAEAADVPAPPLREAPRRALRVLLVDDDAAVRRALAQSLGAVGVKVLQAANGEAALAYVRRLHPDVVLTEVAVPGLDAIGLLAALAGDPSAPVVVVHTEQSDDALDAWLHEAGARAVLRRDMPVDALVARLREEVERG
jgi:general secretion pathway protein E